MAFVSCLIITSLFVMIPYVLSLRVKDTCLQQLGLQINNTFLNPWGTTDQLIRDIYVYFEELDGIRKEIKQAMKDGIDPKLNLTDQYKTFLKVNETGGPIHLHDNINMKRLIDFYKWKREDILEFYEVLQFTREAWKKFKSLMDQKKKHILTLKDKLKLHQWKEFPSKNDKQY